MEIVRINAIPPVPMVKASQSAPDVAGVFAVEFRKRERQEADVADEERAARGLEDEDEAETGLNPEDEHNEVLTPASPENRTISFFA